MISDVSTSPSGLKTPLVPYRRTERNRRQAAVDAPVLDVKRHYHEPSQEEADRIVLAVAELIVDFVKGHRETELPAGSGCPKETMQTEESR